MYNIYLSLKNTALKINYYIMVFLKNNVLLRSVAAQVYLVSCKGSFRNDRWWVGVVHVPSKVEFKK